MTDDRDGDTVPPNILLLMSDEHAFRYLSHLSPERGGEPVHTPTLDALASTGTYFENAYCQVPLCTPSRMCLLTGRDQQNSGAWDNGAVLPPGIPTLPGHLTDAAGYETCLVGKMHFGGSRQFNGFGHRPYGDMGGGLWLCGHQAEPVLDNVGLGDHASGSPFWAEAGVTSIPESMLQEQMVVQESLSFLREHRHRSPTQPWFLCASFSRPHMPFTAPARHFERYWPDGVTPPRIDRSGDAADHPLLQGLRDMFGFDDMTSEDTLRARAAYFACVDYLDEVLGDFLALLEHDGFLDDTIIVYTTDHGEMAGEHGVWFKMLWHEASVRVPLIVQIPEHRRGALAGRAVEAPVSLGDVFPTLCGLTDVPVPDDLDGVDLSASILNSEEPSRGPVASQYLIGRFGDGTQWRMVRDGRFKHVAFQDGPDLLFDLEADPDEQTNLAPLPEYAEVVLAMRPGDPSFFDAAKAQREVDAELRRKYPNRLEPTTGNQILLPDGRLVEADVALYQPDVLTDKPQDAFSDWPTAR